MAMDAVNDIARAGLPIAPEKGAIDKQEVQRLAQQFEAMLMTQMLREMRRSMLDEEEEQEDGFGAGAMTDTADIELGNALSRAGGLGLSDSLLKAFDRQIAPQPEFAAEASRFLPSDIASAAPVSSRFGWRPDPMTGVPRFHEGIDIAVAYGQDVKAAAEGTVAFAGLLNGYGRTVVVDHGGGRQTRYAHLSEARVNGGDVVTEGQVVGKSGNSGRSTGPHLHFEVLVEGRRVDPTHTIAE
jgi:murein DD-endopeptidase MepM/ murein hydrolase activator NlpD